MSTSAGPDSNYDEGRLTAPTPPSIPSTTTVDLLDAPADSSELLGLDAPLMPGTPAIQARNNVCTSPPDNPASSILPHPVPNTQSAAKNTESKASRLSAAEEKTWKEINENAGGSIQRFHDMTIEKMNNGRHGVIFLPEAAIPEADELVGDEKPGYETMALKDKVLAWWTKKQWEIWNDQILKEVSVQ